MNQILYSNSYHAITVPSVGVTETVASNDNNVGSIAAIDVIVIDVILIVCTILCSLSLSCV